MEKKNVALLTVIAVATLLVAVVGATFAYFTATVNKKGTETSTQVTTTKLATVTYKTGDTVTKTDWCPGSYSENKFDIKADEENTAAVKVKISSTSSSTFTTGNLKWKLYEADSEEDLPTVAEGTCSYEALETGGQKYTATGGSFTINQATLKDSGVLSGSDDVDYTVEIPTEGQKYYSLVVKLDEINDDQKDDQGKTASMQLKVEYVKE